MLNKYVQMLKDYRPKNVLIREMLKFFHNVKALKARGGSRPSPFFLEGVKAQRAFNILN